MTFKTAYTPWLTFVLGICLSLGEELSGTPEKPNFQDDVFPLFEQSCNSCHNPDKAKGGLDLTSMSNILAGGSSGDVVVPGDGASSYLYKLLAHLEKPLMPREKDKLPQTQIDLVKKWIDLGLLPTATGKPIAKKKASLSLALSEVPSGKPEGPPPMPEHLALDPAVVTDRPAAISAIAASPWAPVTAIAGQKQVILYHTDTLEPLGILPYPEGFIESLVFSRNGMLLLAGGGRGGKSGRVAAWDVKSGRRLLTMGEEYDTVLASDVSADQTLVALGGPQKRVKVYDVSTGEILHNIKKHSGWVTSLSFSPDGVLLATGDRNGGIYVWEARSGNLFYTLNGHKQSITGLSWRTDSNLLASASEEGSIRTWGMINGKQIRTWTAHGGGTLSVDFDKKGNLVTAGRDKSVKLWKPDGGAIRTISGFPEMTLEARYSHDGSRIIAGDWTGAVGVWNIADGKKLGNLVANPPTLVSRLAVAKKIVGQREPATAAAKAIHVPLAQALSTANKALSEANAEATAAKTAHQAADTALGSAKTTFAQATVAKDQATKEKTNRQSARDQKAKELADTKAAQKGNQGQSDAWGKRSSFRSDQVSLLRETHRKAKEAHTTIPDDASLKEAVNKQQEALDAMEKAFALARDKSAAHLAKAKEFAKLATTHTTALTAAEKALKTAETTLAQREKSHIEKESAMKAAAAEQSAKLSAHNAANATLAQRAKEQKQAVEAEKGSGIALREAEASLASARNSVTKWQAETINLERHVELGKLHDLQDELDGLDVLASEAKALHEGALAALESARKALAEVPAMIKAKKESLAARQAAMATESQALEQNQKEAVEKKGFVEQVAKITAETKAKAAAEAANAEQAEATAKFAETIALLQKDLTNAQAGISAQQNKLKAAQSAAQQAQVELEKTKQQTQAAPKIVEEKQTATNATQAKVAETNKTRDAFKATVEVQRAKAEALLKKYLETLPK